MTFGFPASTSRDFTHIPKTLDKLGKANLDVEILI